MLCHQNCNVAELKKHISMHWGFLQYEIKIKNVYMQIWEVCCRFQVCVMLQVSIYLQTGRLDVAVLFTWTTLCSCSVYYVNHSTMFKQWAVNSSVNPTLDKSFESSDLMFSSIAEPTKRHSSFSLLPRYQQYNSCQDHNMLYDVHSKRKRAHIQHFSAVSISAA